MASAPPPKASGVSGSTYGAVRASKSDLWMIKLPKTLATAWEDAPEGTVLGTLTFTKGGGGGSGPQTKRQKTGGGPAAPSSKITITVEPTLADGHSDLPVDYTLEAMTKKTPGILHPFTRNMDGSVAIHGVVSRTATAQVASDSNAANGAMDTKYRTLLKNRLLETTVNSKRFVQPGGVDAAPAGPSKAATAAASLGKGFGGSVARFGKNMMDAQERSKTMLIGEPSTGPPIIGVDAVRSTLFEYFSKRQHWAVKELRLASGGRLPEKETREVLKDIADYHRIGEYKNMWELKAEYRSSTLSSEAETKGTT
eukprot:scaffold4649_cov72-Cyclotella_meneghiniana.AAC.2